MIEKVCSKCGESFPATAEYFFRSGATIDKFQCKCKKCSGGWLRWPPKGFKVCSRCKKEFPKTLEYFNKDSKKEDGFNGHCKICRKNRMAKYRESNNRTINNKQKKYYEENSKKLIATNTSYAKKNSAKTRADRRAWMKKDAKYKPQLEKYEQVQNVDGYLVVECAYCGKSFIPKNSQVRQRIGAINGTTCGEGRFYCSDGCKESCPTFNQTKYPKGFKKATSREANPQLRQLVLKRDNYACQKCGATEYLHCHHVVPATQNPMTANNPDSCVTLCKSCHKAVHQKAGCKYHELKCA